MSEKAACHENCKVWTIQASPKVGPISLWFPFQAKQKINELIAVDGCLVIFLYIFLQQDQGGCLPKRTGDRRPGLIMSWTLWQGITSGNLLVLSREVPSDFGKNGGGTRGSVPNLLVPRKSISGFGNEPGQLRQTTSWIVQCGVIRTCYSEAPPPSPSALGMELQHLRKKSGQLANKAGAARFCAP